MGSGNKEGDCKVAFLCMMAGFWILMILILTQCLGVVAIKLGLMGLN